MKIAYFDCPTGASGNMILAALIDAGVSLPYLKNELKKINIKGYELVVKETIKKGFRAKHLDVVISDDGNRTISDIYSLIKKSKLKLSIKRMALIIFKRLYEAEKKVHAGHTKMHLHEVGATDAIVDIVGTVIALDKLGVKEVYSSPLPCGYGAILHGHGILPNPAPATALLLKGASIYKKDIKGELVTPTGAVLITSLAKSYSALPKAKVLSLGLGSGTSDLNEANILRAFICETDTPFDEDLIFNIEANIDNMDPKKNDSVISELMRDGALDASIRQIKMKKGRTGILLSVMCEIKDKEKLTKTIFKITPTIGVRTYLLKRDKLKRYFIKIKTRFGPINVKVGVLDKEILNISPEYEDCAKAARQTKASVTSIMSEARAKAIQKLRGRN